MKKLLISFLFMGAAMAFNSNRQEVQQINDEDGFFSQQQSHTITSTNGNSVMVSHHTNSDGKREIYISVASPKIRIDGEYFVCGNMTCPANAFKCHITSEAIAEKIEFMKTITECFDKEGKSLERKEIEETNPFPKANPPFSRVVNVDRDGEIAVEDSTGNESFSSTKIRQLTKEEQEKLQKELAEHTKKMQEDFLRHQQMFEQQMQLMHQNLANTFKQSFGNNFPFGNYNPFQGFGGSFGSPNFGSNFPFGNSFSSSFDDDWPFSFNHHRRPVFVPQSNNNNNNQNVPQIPNNNNDNVNVAQNTRNKNNVKETEFIGENDDDNHEENDASIELATNRYSDNEIDHKNRFNDKYQYSVVQH